MIKKVYFILMFVFLSTNAFANACENIVFDPKLMFYSSYGKLEYDLSRDVEYITNLAKEKNHQEKFVAGGLALSTLEMSVKLDAEASYEKINDICVVPKTVHVFVGFENPTIYVANNYKEGTCQFYITLRHEQAHMQINKKTLEYFLPHFKDAIQEVIQDVKPLNIGNANDVKQASEYLNQQYYFKIKDLVVRFNEILSEEQSKLDSESNYAYEDTLCK